MSCTNALTKLKNICLSTNNQSIYDKVKMWIDSHSQEDVVYLSRASTAIFDLINEIKQKSVYDINEVFEIFKKIGIHNFQLKEQGKESISFVVKKNDKLFEIKQLYPTDSYSLNSDLWKVVPFKVNDKTYKEAKQLAKDLNSQFKYKSLDVEINEDTCTCSLSVIHNQQTLLS